MKSFNVHSVVDHAWKHRLNVSVGNKSELQVHRRMGSTGDERMSTFVLMFTVFWGKEEKGHPLSASRVQQKWFQTLHLHSKQVKSFILLLVVGVIVHLSPHCAFMFDSFPLQNVLIYVCDCSFSQGNCQCCWACAALCITLQSNTRHLGWERLVSQVMRAARSSHFQ